jgi:holliday junction DNA helicase RuvA
MISYLSGIIRDVSENAVIIDVNGVGYRVVIPEKIHSSLSKIGGEVNLYIRSAINVREGTFDLYGFDSPEELKFFNLLITVSGIGPKNAQNILSEVDMQTLQLAIVKGDDQYLKKVSGIGGKTAQRIILELKTKVMTSDLGSVDRRDLGAESEAIDALVSLGYSIYQARDVLKEVSKKAKTIEDKVKEALRLLGKNK